MNVFLSAIVALASLVVIISVVLQESEQAGLGTLDGSAGDSWGSNRGTSKKQMLQRVTTIASVVLFVALIAVAAID